MENAQSSKGECIVCISAAGSAFKFVVVFGYFAPCIQQRKCRNMASTTMCTFMYFPFNYLTVDYRSVKLSLFAVTFQQVVSHTSVGFQVFGD